MRGIVADVFEPPTAGAFERLVRSAVHTHETEIFDGTAAKLLPRTREAMDALIDSSTQATIQMQRRVRLAQHALQCPED